MNKKYILLGLCISILFIVIYVMIGFRQKVLTIKVKNSKDLFIHVFETYDGNITFSFNQSSNPPDEGNCSLICKYGNGGIVESNFFTEQVGEIIYLTMIQKNRVCFIYDLSTNNGYPTCNNNYNRTALDDLKIADQIFDKLNRVRPNLIRDWGD